MSLRYRNILLMLPLVVLTACGESEDAGETEANVPVSAVNHPFALEALEVRTEDGAVLGRVDALVVDAEQQLLAHIARAEGDVVARPEQMLISGDHAVLAQGVSPSDLPAYDPEIHHPFGARVDP